MPARAALVVVRRGVESGVPGANYAAREGAAGGPFAKGSACGGARRGRDAAAGRAPATARYVATTSAPVGGAGSAGADALPALQSPGQVQPWCPSWCDGAGVSAGAVVVDASAPCAERLLAGISIAVAIAATCEPCPAAAIPSCTGQLCTRLGSPTTRATQSARKAASGRFHRAERVIAFESTAVPLTRQLREVVRMCGEDPDCGSGVGGRRWTLGASRFGRRRFGDAKCAARHRL